MSEDHHGQQLKDCRTMLTQGGITSQLHGAQLSREWWKGEGEALGGGELSK